MSSIQIENVSVEVVQPSVDQRIVNQLEFYFGDSNLPFDRFLLKEIAKDDGWVTISVLLTFRKLAGICSNPVTIATAVRNSPDSIVEIDKTNSKIRRKKDMPVLDAKGYMNEAIKRSVCCDGFPARATMDDLLSFAASIGNKVITKVTPRKFQKKFQGTVYITFVSKEEAEKFVGYKSVRYNCVELKRMWLMDYIRDMSGGDDGWRKNATKRSEFQKGYLLKADVVDDAVTVMDIKNFFIGLGLHVPFVWIDSIDEKAWIRLDPQKSAKEILKTVEAKKNNLITNIVIPEEKDEETVLNIMAKQCLSL